MTFISPTNDFFFRYLFGKTGHEAVTLDFVNAVLGDMGMGPLQSLTIQNPFNPKESVTDKQSILDVKAKDETGRTYNIEMQLQGNAEFANRSLYYWSKCYTAQLHQGSDYRTLSPVICINVVNFPMLKESRRVHNCFLLTEFSAPHVVLTDHLMIHFLHLTELEKTAYTDGKPLHQWLRYLSAREDTMKGLQTVLDSNPAIKKAAELQHQFTADDLLMEQYEARQKYLHDIATIKGVAYDEGLEKGEQIGLEKGEQIGLEKGEQIGLEKGEQIGFRIGLDRKDRCIVHTMHNKGLDVDTISQYTNISPNRVEQILNEPPSKEER
ncbi:MAG: Rpn family recombination-promoting nuclease/putative transposase [Deltaproteobacteria bacterium]|nr:Rpn family recombination-promoting nuclease/putative transposase [Deltaproteobacteria bacterium]MBN2670359.1 Rpn family recombination-promoting nuclease/putative transposase [Deltaproteobacteria bacterium]